jgi:hypothetical protein
MKNKQTTKFSYEGVDTKGPAPLEPGVYRAKITNAELKTSKQGNDMIEVSLEVFEDGQGNELPKKRKLTDRVVVTEKALFRVAILAEALSIPNLEDDAEDTIKDWCEKIKEAGSDGVWMRLAHEPYQAINDQGESETRQSMRVGRYLKTASVADSRTIGASNGAATEAPRRPRRTGGATAEA